MVVSIGIDFGTTNTVLAVATPDGDVATARFATDGEASGGCRTVLSFTPSEDRSPRRPIEVEVGPWAIRRYLSAPEECRFVQSPKSYLGSTSFRDTRIFGRTYRLEDLIAEFLREMTARADGLDTTGLNDPGTDPAHPRCVAGRPVAFWGSDPDDTLAMTRLKAAYGASGLGRPRFVHEPVAASYFFATRLDHDATVLVVDLGGGTTDFSVIHYGAPERSKGNDAGNAPRVEPIAHRGVGIGGDRFDFRIVQNAVAPLVGKGSTYTSFGKRYAIPAVYFNRIASWHEFSFLRTPEILRDLAQIVRDADEPERMRRLLRLVDGNLGFHLNHRVTEAKTQLSSEETVTLSLRDLGIDAACDITRDAFEAWIAPDLDALGRHLDATLTEVPGGADGIDVVFMTGGSSLVPAVRRLFERRFGADRLRSGDEFQSVAKGLALIGLLEDQRPWTYDGA